MAMSQAEGSAAQTIDVVDFIDRQPVGGFQIRLLLTCAAVLFLDGFDTQAIGYVAPALAKEWGRRAATTGYRATSVRQVARSGGTLLSTCSARSSLRSSLVCLSRPSASFAKATAAGSDPF